MKYSLIGVNINYQWITRGMVGSINIKYIICINLCINLYNSENEVWKNTKQFHLANVSRKVSRGTGVKYNLSAYILITLYNSKIYPHFNYCLSNWGSDIQDIFLIEKKVIRIL